MQIQQRWGKFLGKPFVLTGLKVYLSLVEVKPIKSSSLGGYIRGGAVDCWKTRCPEDYLYPNSAPKDEWDSQQESIGGLPVGICGSPRADLEPRKPNSPARI
ncbi:hypothetical protein PGT21_018925 [Puccinia graminis f. sp. tritici]|uniref:Uncharacterized protein n=1 Tax=Puccinia graminis f. sp. tritici TaxID=56615 RepID=A0A5B0QE52_PUCGR|nr:hypothetical protein PGT21_024062 [Puccinia graminis f. sp. tritici]KAA1103474.1 hypothetical protein PGT21_018925 [Puccinia graminis f. sp. tritici]KAA1111223.1 hypothetical protein PGTUg99_001257 [Puccinia graminis f. sp. tritici]